MVTVARHEKALRQMRCVVSGSPFVTLHHCHGGSMLELGRTWPNPGMGQRQNPFLQIPLAPEYHCWDGGKAIDGMMGVQKWEDRYGSQVEFLKEVDGQITQYSLWEEAMKWAMQYRAKSAS